ncbi:MAG TPA: asparaginase [Jatrophihabitans sp.]|nr:asparaginase [Jatrophihabitans sp.]
MPGAGQVAYFALGGTISMTGGTGTGVVARLTGDDLLAGLGELPAPVEVHSPYAVPSASLTFADVLDVVERAEAAVAAGARGVVVSQGTDTLEETAFLVDSVWRPAAPFVLTGAMRNPSLPGADGPANLAAAIRVAAAEDARGRGALVVFAEEIHAARHVRKSHSTSTGTFVSANLGPVGHVVEGTPRFLADLPPRTPVAGWTRDSLARTRIALYTAALDDDGSALDGLEHTAAGLVVAGFGAGHVPEWLVPRLTPLLAAVPVVLSSRTGAGPVLADTYGAPGGERDLLARGAISAGFADPFKARVLLRLLVAGGADRSAIAAAFAALG